MEKNTTRLLGFKSLTISTCCLWNSERVWAAPFGQTKRPDYIGSIGVITRLPTELEPRSPL